MNIEDDPHGCINSIMKMMEVTHEHATEHDKVQKLFDGLSDKLKAKFITNMPKTVKKFLWRPQNEGRKAAYMKKLKETEGFQKHETKITKVTKPVPVHVISDTERSELHELTDVLRQVLPTARSNNYRRISSNQLEVELR